MDGTGRTELTELSKKYLENLTGIQNFIIIISSSSLRSFDHGNKNDFSIGLVWHSMALLQGIQSQRQCNKIISSSRTRKAVKTSSKQQLQKPPVSSSLVSLRIITIFTCHFQNGNIRLYDIFSFSSPIFRKSESISSGQMVDTSNKRNQIQHQRDGCVQNRRELEPKS